jgi:Zn finger protein HypA/HybF involved in hydrogenase expression
VVLLVLAGALTMILLAVLGQLAHDNFAVPFADQFRFFQLRSWQIGGIAAFLIALVVFVVVALRPSLIFQVKEVTPRTMKPELHVRCRNCSTVSRVEDTGQRPLDHFCPKCGQTGEYAGPESGEKGFIYTRIEMKLGCTRCNTTFRIPEPLVRPLFTQCPNCGSQGVLRENQRPQDAVEVPLRCARCGSGYHVYDVTSQWSPEFPCPKCGHVNPMPALA